MPNRVTLFAIATLAPVPLLFIGAVWGGWWIVAALVYLTVFTFLLDELVTFASTPADPEVEFPAALNLSVLLGVLHFALIILGVLAVTGATGLVGWERLLAFFGFGLFFGQVSNSNAHELIHRPDPRLRVLGHWVFISHLFGHHASAHPKVHHRFVGSENDPNSAPLGQSFYRFAPLAWIGSFKRGFAVETQQWRARPDGWLRHPYVMHIAGAVLCIGIAFAIGGGIGLLAYLGLAIYATAQLLMSDYVQHYGLRRHVTAGGRLEPVGPQHSWNAPHWFSTYLMLAAPRHSDHHAHPAKPFPALDLAADQVPTLPRSLPAMGFLALFPRLWRRIMDPRVAKWVDPTTTAD